MKTGLFIKPTTQEDFELLNEYFLYSDYSAEYDNVEEAFFLAEKKQNIAELEYDISQQHEIKDINYTFYTY